MGGAHGFIQKQAGLVLSIVTIKSKLYKVLLSAVLAFCLFLFKNHQLSVSNWRQLRGFPLSLEANKQAIATN